MWGRAKGLDFKLFHKQVGNKGANGGTHGSTMDLFVILTWKKKHVFLRQKSRSVTISCIDMLVLCGSSGSCCNFCLTTLMEGPMGTEVEVAFLS